MKWSIELGEFDIQYRPWTAIKAQVIADFVAKFTPSQEDQVNISPETNPQIQTDKKATWTLFVDGSSNAHASGAGLIITSPAGENIAYALWFGFKATNNEAGYEALIAGLKLAEVLRVEQLIAYTDSQLIAGQVRAEYEAKHEKMKAYLRKVEELKNHFTRFSVHQIPREKNANADALARLATALDPEVNRAIPLEYLDKPSTLQEVQKEVQQLVLNMGWAEPIIKYFKEGELPKDINEARKVKIRAARYTLIKGVLYKKVFSLPYLRCVSAEEARYILKEIHEGDCGNHAGGRSLAHKAIRQGYYWPTVQKDAMDYAKKCDKCQRFSNVPKQPPEELTPMTGPWPFAQWRMDLIGIKNHYSSPGHPQANGQAEVANRSILQMIKKKLKDKKGTWPEELPSVLWAYRTTARTLWGETPFLLAFGSEAVVPAEVGVTNFRTEHYEPRANERELLLSLDLIEERRELTQIRTAAYQQMVSRYYNAKV
ncbi:uncharacterized protein LOC132296579 [Cornus florida]|uniref:uncharacterized protein LOC132296579 n=1 Tax=Cornus florida TaxID=4283 RepID=UPI0028A1FA70|nr:uncharacterized protein LOC132296579 [Cornus florida]